MTALLEPIFLLPLAAMILGGWIAISAFVDVVRGLRARRGTGGDLSDGEVDGEHHGQLDGQPSDTSLSTGKKIAWNLLVGVGLGLVALHFGVQISRMAPGLVGAHELVGQQIELGYVGLESGEEHHLDEHRGKVVLLNYWATWCPPCRREMPHLDRLQKERAGDGLVVLHLSSEPAVTLRGWLTQNPMSTVHGRPLGRQLPIPAYPTTYVIDREGTSRTVFVGAKSYGAFRDAVEPLL